DAVINDPVFFPTCQPKRGGAVEEVVLACPLPDEVPRVLGIDADWASPVALRSFERARAVGLETPLPVGYRTGVVTRRRRHEADPEHATIRRVATTFHSRPISSIPPPEISAPRCRGDLSGGAG